MKSRTHFDSVVEFWDRLGDPDKAIAAYLKLHPEEAEDEAMLRRIIEREKQWRSYSIFEYFSDMSWGKDEYSPEIAVAEYLEMHPDKNEAEVRAELSRELAKIGEIWPEPEASQNK